MDRNIPGVIKESDLIETQCKKYPSVTVGKSGKCYKRDFCDYRDTSVCGEVLSFNKKLIFLEEANVLKKVI